MSIDDKLRAAFKNYEEGSLSKAEAAFSEIIQEQPDNTDVLYVLSELSFRRGDYDSSAKYMGEAIRHDPSNAGAYANLGLIMQAKGRVADAMQCYRRALDIDPAFAEAYVSLGNVLKDNGQFSDAIATYQAALRLRPDMPDVYMNLTVALLKAGRFDEAAHYSGKGVDLDPHNANMYYNLGIAFQESGRLKEAIDCYERASGIAPDDAEICNNLAFALQEFRQPHAAIPYYRKALQLDPAYATAHWNLSLALLLTGNFREGWREYEWRWKTEYLASSRRDFREPLWDGSDIDGRTILLHTEQGFGDAFQFVRYAPLVARHGAEVILECPEGLVSLLKTVEGITRIIVRGQELPKFDLHCPLLSLPLAFGTEVETIPAKVPYLRSKGELNRKWKDRIGADGSKMRIGVTWAGNPGFKQNRYRNIPLERFAPLSRIPGVTLYSLQKGEEAEETKDPPVGMRIIDYTADIRDFSDTAALIENLDLVISVDTAVAHLTGALGRPVWTLLPFSPEWRWLLNREDSPWYPTMRLFRQDATGEWGPVIERVRAELIGRLLE